jgi:hypothetical protein
MKSLDLELEAFFAESERTVDVWRMIAGLDRSPLRPPLRIGRASNIARPHPSRTAGVLAFGANRHEAKTSPRE